MIEGHRILVRVIGSIECYTRFLKELENNSTLFRKLDPHNKVSPQNVYQHKTNEDQHQLAFIAKTTPYSAELLQEVENITKTM